MVIEKEGEGGEGMKRYEFVSFYASLPLKERGKPACLLTYRQVWKMLEILKKEAKQK